MVVDEQEKLIKISLFAPSKEKKKNYAAYPLLFYHIREHVKKDSCDTLDPS